MSSSTLIKTIFRNSIAEGIYKEITNRSGRYYYFLGRTLSWDTEASPPVPVDNVNYDRFTRGEMITAKEITPSDVSFVVPRYDWQSGTIYDQYDDQYDTKLKGINLIRGGSEFTAIPNVYIGSMGSVNFMGLQVYNVGDFLKTAEHYYIVTVTGTSSETAPTHTSGTQINGSASLQYVEVRDEDGSGATAIAIMGDNRIIGIELTNSGIGYTGPPTVIIAGPQGVGLILASAESVISIGYKSEKQKLEDCEFYVLTDDYNVYICLDNNNNSKSTSKPTDVDFMPKQLLDGYVWKFMYNVPIGLRNKFLTPVNMPVVTSIQDQFYSNGNIQVARVAQEGTGYTGAAIAVLGNGYLEDNPIYLEDLVIDLSGSNYISPIVTIDPPFANVQSWTSGIVVISGQKYSHLRNIYEISVSGRLGSLPPMHKYGSVSNGTALLKYIGTTAIATATQIGGSINALVVDNNIRDVSMLTFGLGYTSTPIVTFSGGGGVDATGFAIMVNSTISRIIVTDSGSGYTSAPTIIIGTRWAVSTYFSAGIQISYGAGLYTVMSAGTTGATESTFNSSAPGHPVLRYDGKCAAAYCTLKCGAGYSTKPNVTILSSDTSTWELSNLVSPGDKITYGQNAYVVTSGGVLSTSTPPTHEADIVTTGSFIVGTQYTILLPGNTNFTLIGASSNTAGVIFTATGIGGGTTGTAKPSVINGTAKLRWGWTLASASFRSVGSQAKLIPIIEDGKISYVQIDDGGIGYTYANLFVSGDGTGAVVTSQLSSGDANTLQSNIELLTVSGSICNIPVISGGYEYTGTATVSITGDGTGATATAVIKGGAIYKINITNYGEGYTLAYATISGTGAGAKLRVIISPYGGHGKEALNNLFARTLMFYSNISADKNQGFTVNNDYRQLGIIKNPRKYGTTYTFNSASASACWAITCDQIINTNIFPIDSLLYLNLGLPSQSRFRIVSNAGTTLLLQSLDNGVLVLNSALRNIDGIVLVAITVTAPTIDKYSGDLLYIDNKVAFTPSASQLVSIRTVLKF